MKIAIAGGTGFVGKALTKSLVQRGDEVLILTRNIPSIKEEGVRYVKWLGESSTPEYDLNGVDAIINLAGESLNSGRWTEARKERIYNSRIHATREIVRIIGIMKNKPSTLINASAVGYYGISRTDTFTEEIAQHSQDFLGEVVWSWEEEARTVEQFGVRVVFSRFGVILGKDEGALPRIVLPYKLFAGGTVGSGKQWLSWIHVDDVVGMILFAITHDQITGPLNVVSPSPVTMKEFGKSVGKVLRKPHWLPVPGFALKLLLGEMSILVLEGQKVLPKVAEQHGYKFIYSTIDEALENILKS
ncbi:TIGR01777 family oxidoreductase [Bacillus suaedaesalsae]|uniref:TIGR01777 family oxidoreductase n=1 Tax=Bacillus suaedaesalsae TaxID=2810349 RepID=A0ABS2DFY8_9BACI|nr:TIGR01777 family oxidoreductase [Bacillus suaedaesalsae]MBM6616468.1 TIGR01777 family oxidoreductase [Bacillus suaedaesalsae]